jgi:hypothetical protein
VSERRVPVRFAGDEHELVAAEAARAGQSLSRFIARAALARAAYLRGRAGEHDPFDRPPREDRP